ncbi:MAG: outer membrane beta-barrel protein [Deltaproteobacteria bacterium]|nr:outer membrane beta-barrel protein [Deltaproteobacteria bacterium]MBI3296189.1 outer membrane beta-barrel protein [Deltaproteobacteria bacterium]
MPCRLLVILLVLCLHHDLMAAPKRDFKGLFGSYRRERFTENEARSTDFGMDFSLSTLLPVGSIVQSSESGSGYTPLNYAAFFDAEVSFLLSFGYHFQTFLSIGYYDYSTRKENAATSSTAKPPQFHDFDMTAIPILLGARYRFGTEDIVPYLGAGVGMANVHQKAYYEYSSEFDDITQNVVAGQLIAGLEFYVSSRVGLRLEMSGFVMALPAGGPWTPSGTTSFPSFQYSGSPISVRYASGLFWLF